VTAETSPWIACSAKDSESPMPRTVPMNPIAGMAQAM